MSARAQRATSRRAVSVRPPTSHSTSPSNTHSPERDSPRDQAIVTLFLLTVCALLLYAGVRTKLRKAIEDRGQPTDLREWGEALLPTSLVEYTRAREMRTAAGTYERVTVG